MPSYSPASALAKAYGVNGAPWNYPRWQEITGVRHGLNPKDDCDLPHGLSRSDATKVLAYFAQLHAPNQTETWKTRFATAAFRRGQDPNSGRSIWQDYVNGNWASKWKMHTRISKILTDLNIHPLQLKVESRQYEGWPNSTAYIGLAIDKVGREIFGSEALTENGLVIPGLRDIVIILIQRTWKTTKGPATKTLNSVMNEMRRAENALSVLESEDVAVADVKDALDAAMKLKRLTSGCRVREALEVVEKLESKLEVFVAELEKAKGAMKKGNEKSKEGGSNQAAEGKKPKKPAASLASVASASDVRGIRVLYEDFFRREELPAPELEVAGATGIDFGEEVDGKDPGVEVEAGLTSAQLAASLGFEGERPLLFNEYRHKSGSATWDLGSSNVASADVEPLSLQWHQLCGVHSIARHIFQETSSPDHVTGMLLGDDVGLGKTIQSAATLAFLADLRVRQECKARIPPIIQERPYLKDHSLVPDKPHLIIAPGTLIDQWETELKTYFRPKSIDIFIYRRSTSDSATDNFWTKENGERSSASLPWDHPEPKPHHNALMASTLYGQDYLSVTVDEAQSARNSGSKHSSILRLLENSTVRLILTATPLQTSTKDIAAMGRFVGLPFFFSEEAHREQVADASALRKARAEREEFASEDDPVREVQMSASWRMQKQFCGMFIRRKASSLGPNGCPLIQLPPLEIIHGILKLTPRELEIIDSISAEGITLASDANGRSATSNSFYLEHRKSVSFAQEKPNEKIPKFASLEEWEMQKSTKIDTVVRITKHHLSRDDAPPVAFEDGKAVYPPMPTSAQFTRDKKVIIFQEFTYCMALVQNIFKLYGMNKPLIIQGRHSFKQRASIVDKFNKDPNHRVLIFSKVGSTGLNLTRASIVIFLDQPWSAQDEWQIIGRAYRQRQSKPVTVIQLLAANTADITLSLLARGKKDMLDAFFGLDTETSRLISRTIQGELITNVDEDFEVDTPLDKMANASSGDEKKRRKRGKKVVGAGEPAQESREGTTGSATVARKGNGEVKGGAAVTADSDAGRSAEPPGVGSSTRQQNLETSKKPKKRKASKYSKSKEVISDSYAGASQPGGERSPVPAGKERKMDEKKAESAKAMSVDSRSSDEESQPAQVKEKKEERTTAKKAKKAKKAKEVSSDSSSSDEEPQIAPGKEKKEERNRAKKAKKAKEVSSDSSSSGEAPLIAPAKERKKGRKEKKAKAISTDSSSSDDESQPAPGPYELKRTKVKHRLTNSPSGKEVTEAPGSTQMEEFQPLVGAPGMSDWELGTGESEGGHRSPSASMDVDDYDATSDTGFGPGHTELGDESMCSASSGYPPASASEPEEDVRAHNPFSGSMSFGAGGQARKRGASPENSRQTQGKRGSVLSTQAKKAKTGPVPTFSSLFGNHPHREFLTPPTTERPGLSAARDLSSQLLNPFVRKDKQKSSATSSTADGMRENAEASGSRGLGRPFVPPARQAASLGGVSPGFLPPALPPSLPQGERTYQRFKKATLGKGRK